MYINKNDSAPSSQKYYLKGETIWSGGKGLRLVDESLCDECFYTIGIEAGRGAVVIFTAFTLGNERVLRFFQPLGDIIQHKNESHYILDITTLKEADVLFIEVMPSSGDPDLYISCSKERPTSLEGYHWFSEETSLEQVTISWGELQTKCEQREKLYITVASEWSTSYEISAYLE